MAQFYKVALRGQAEGQEIVNILYYSSALPDGLAWDVADATSLGEAVEAAWTESAMVMLPTLYTLTQVDVSMVDENGKTVSPFTVVVPSGETGDIGLLTAGVSQVAIVSFQCDFVTMVEAHPVPRRSYLAMGPMWETAIESNGSLNNVSALAAAYLPAVTQGHLIGGTQLLPYRVGRTSGSTISGVGRVVGAVVRPFTSFRRSRLRPPSGG